MCMVLHRMISPGSLAGHGPAQMQELLLLVPAAQTSQQSGARQGLVTSLTVSGSKQCEGLSKYLCARTRALSPPFWLSLLE